ncbi:O-antigen/teichoic acid export membrane protein [Bacillus oleivorans]|uniref:O-antigen/teichoic acid export membrane protein n=1 Tax=Bacillus oleivorans TaxID=1448271 RepID=A0A285CJA5_9BACI|nr:oligosaccharide flippase family protein [Bacillus oleivorans]SNX67086.1 O-antigen/teichoic acid export membrane protein [Bacillus oleivorans]
MSQNRAKLFIENFLLYGGINALNKVVPLLMLPIITRLLTDTAEYGRFDMFITIISFGSSFAILGMYDALYREYFEKESKEYKEQVTSTALTIVLIASVIVFFILLIFNKQFSQFFLGDTKSSPIVIMAAIGIFITANQSIFAAPTRMHNKRKIYLISGLSYSVIYYVLAIGLIFWGYGYKGLLYGNILATFFLLVFFIIINKKYFDIRKYNSAVAKNLFKIGLPLLPTFLAYWVYRSMDKIMITNLLDLGQVGIYSIGARVASVSQFIYTAFAGGWQYFAFSTMKDKDQVELTSKVFEYLGIISFLAFLIATLFDDIIFEILFSGPYEKGVSVFPYLFLSPLLLMLFQTAGNQFLVIKKSYIITISLILGVAVNLLLNYILIQQYGIKGSALATLVGYAVSLLIVVIIDIKLKLLKVSLKFIVMSILLTLTIINLFLFDTRSTNIYVLLSICLISSIYIKDVKLLMNVLKKPKKVMDK